MTSIDDLFKKPFLPSEKKRKSDAHRDPNEIYKTAKLNGNRDVKTNGHAKVEEEVDENEDDGTVAGPEIPDDLEEGPEDDEEGRFFGGGISNDTAEVLNFIDERELDGSVKQEKIDLAWLRRLALNFEKKISKNAELRAKFEGEPQKFMGSEADLDADIKALSTLSEHPELYEEFAQLGCVSSLVSLLAHENTDIAIDAIEIISELIDEDVNAGQVQWDALVDAMLDADLLSLLSQNLARLDETIDSDRDGVYHILGVFESLSSRPILAERIGENASIMKWLYSRAKKPEVRVSQNKQYSTEVLAILLQSSNSTRKQFLRLNGIDVFLQLLSAYRKRDPGKGTEEEEFVENAFDCVTCCVDDLEGKQQFLESEGVELCLIMLKEGKMSRPRALRLLDHALGGASGTACCERLVEAAGLKVLFSIFMKKHDSQTTEHLLGILGSMLRLLPGDSAPRIRLLGKFVEKEYEKIRKLIQLRREYASKVAAVDRSIENDRRTLSTPEQKDFADEWLSRRLDAGLFCLQTIDIVLAWLIAEDDGAKSTIHQLMAERDESLGNIKSTLEEQLADMKDAAEGDDGTIRDVLSTLIAFL